VGSTRSANRGTKPIPPAPCGADVARISADRAAPLTFEGTVAARLKLWTAGGVGALDDAWKRLHSSRSRSVNLRSCSSSQAGACRRASDGGFVWHVASSFLDDEELTPGAPAK
jgi:hypothetical protein